MTSYPSFVAASHAIGGLNDNYNATQVSITLPSGIQNGDLGIISAAATKFSVTSDTPAGWTQQVAYTDSSTHPPIYIFTKTLSASDSGAPVTWNMHNPTITGHAHPFTLEALVYRGPGIVAGGTGANYGSGLSVASLTCTPEIAPASLVTFWAAAQDQQSPQPWTPGSGLTQRDTASAEVTFNNGTFDVYDSIYSLAADAPAAGAQATTETATPGGDSSTRWVGAVLAVHVNNPPNKPTTQVGSYLDSTATNRITAPFSDPDTGDSPSRTDFQWWDLDGTGARVGGPYTKTVTGATPTYWDAPGGTFSNGNKEIQAQSYDALGTPSGWGPSSFFTAATPTGVPTITDPINGGTISTQTYTVAWSTAGGQVGYQVRRVADNAGAADATTVYWDSGQVTDANARSLSVPFETNNRWEHVQLRVTADGTLWSSWADARVDVSYTAPAAPTVSLSPDAGSGSLLVNIANPTPGAGQPSASYNEVWVDDGQGAGWERVATYLATNTAYRYELPVSGRSYSGNAKVTAVGTNGVTSETIA